MFSVREKMSVRTVASVILELKLLLMNWLKTENGTSGNGISGGDAEALGSRAHPRRSAKGQTFTKSRVKKLVKRLMTCKSLHIYFITNQDAYDTRRLLPDAFLASDAFFPLL